MIIGNAKVPMSCCNAHSFTPTMMVGTGTSDNAPFAKVQGPSCFGGCSEFCCDFHFKVSKPESAAKTGDLADIVKKKPSSLAGGFKELITDADVFELSFKDPNLTPEQKATLLGTLLLTDYTYFEQGENDKCGVDEEGKFYINLCNCYFCGVVTPCLLKQGQGGE